MSPRMLSRCPVVHSLSLPRQHSRSMPPGRPSPWSASRLISSRVDKAMGKMVVVQGDAVSGKDTHKVTGFGPTPPGLVFTGSGVYVYTGSMTDSLSTFVKIGGLPVVLVASQSSLNPGETGKGHNAALGTD